MKLVVADEHPLMLEGVRAALSGEDIEIVGETTDGAAVLPLVARLRPDMALLSLHLPRVDGLTCLELLQSRLPATKVVIMSRDDDAERIRGAFQRGAAGYIVKSIGPRDLASVLRQTLQGTVFRTVAATDTQPADRVGLTDQETLVLQAVARGLSNREIAAALWVSEQTVKFHLGHVYRKLGVRNRTEAARAAYALGLVENPALDREEGPPE